MLSLVELILVLMNRIKPFYFKEHIYQRIGDIGFDMLLLI